MMQTESDGASDSRPAPGPQSKPRSQHTTSAAPAGLFTNLFVLQVPRGGLSPILRASEKNAPKEELVKEYRRPSFYRSGNEVYAFGEGLNEFNDGRFTRAIVMPDRDRFFTCYLAGRGLLAHFRSAGYVTRKRGNELHVIDPDTVLASDSAERVVLRPVYTFRPFFGRDVEGRTWFAVAVDVSWTTIPQFRFLAGLTGFEDLFRGLRVENQCSECELGCPLYAGLGRTVGVFRGFASADREMETPCSVDNDYRDSIVIYDRRAEREWTVPGSMFRPAPFQRSVLNAFGDAQKLVKQARVWLGDLTVSGAVRSSALAARYSRIDGFLAKNAGSDGQLSFQIPTGQRVALTREAMSVEEVVYD